MTPTQPLNPTVPVGTRLPPELMLAVRAAASEQGVTVSVFVRIALEAHEDVQAHLEPAPAPTPSNGKRTGNTKLRIKGSHRAA